MNNIEPQFYLSGHDAWEAMLADCAGATTCIDLEQYIFVDDDIGRKFIDVLRERSRAGVKVRIICDAVGSWYLYNSSEVLLMKKDGIEIRFVNPVSPWRINNFFSWFFRDHRKILVIDKKIGYTGSLGIRDDMHSWRETTVRVGGNIVTEMSVTFNEMWLRTADTDVISRINKARSYTRGFNFVTNSPYFRKRFLYTSVIDALRGAHKYIYITVPYFVPDPRLIRVLKLAVRRGVDVRIIVPGHSVEPFVGLAAQSFYEELLRYGVKIYIYKKVFLHAKTIAVDDEWATVGSFNLDSLSFFYNYEANIISTESSFVVAIKNHFEVDLADAHEVILSEWIKRPFWEKIREFLIIPLRGLL